MPSPANPSNPSVLAQQARRSYTEGLLNGLPSVVQAVDTGARILVSQVAEPSVDGAKPAICRHFKTGHFE